MPTGYTANVENGKVTDLRSFALQLARGMGALVMMRDDPWDAPIPEQFEPSDYHSKKIIELNDQIFNLRAMSTEHAQAAADQALVEHLEREAKYREEHGLKQQRYGNMIAKVEAWQNAPEGLKEFALQQLNEGRKFDCGGEYKSYTKAPTGDGGAWRNDELNELTRRVLYHSKEQANEIKRTAERNVWLAQLHASLPADQS